MNGERIGRHFYMSDKGEVTLSRRLASEGVLFGTLEDGMDAWKQSEPYQMLARWEWVLREHSSPCTSCEVFKMCSGYFADLHSPRDVTCEAAKSMLLDLAAAAAVLRQATSPGGDARVHA